jgi:ADP-ribose pyrophosphatase
MPDGSAAVREVVSSSGAAVVLPVNGKGEAVLVRQYRYAAGSLLLEAPAGKLEKGEDPRACAARELKEETGYSSGRMVSLGTIYSSPGVFDEQLHLFLALDLTCGDSCPDEGEFIETVHMPLEALTRDIMRGKIRDAKTVAIILMANEFLKGNKYRAE